jgi:mitogen-activated protein kinase 1/3
MLLREPLFPGNDYIHQLKLIIKFLGTPKQEDIEFVKNAKALRFLTKLAISKPKKWKDVFAGDDGINLEAIDLLSQMLLFNPAKRISIERALQHPYLATFYDPADITEAPAFDFGFDLPDDELSKEALIELLCEDIEAFHPGKIPRKMPTIGNNTSRFFGMGMTASAS